MMRAVACYYLRKVFSQVHVLGLDVLSNFTQHLLLITHSVSQIAWVVWLTLNLGSSLFYFNSLTSLIPFSVSILSIKSF